MRGRQRKGPGVEMFSNRQELLAKRGPQRPETSDWTDLAGVSLVAAAVAYGHARLRPLRNGVSGS